jgi:signal transduction histidine kinase
VTTRTAKVISRSLIAVTIVAFVAGLVLSVSLAGRQEPGRIVIVGDPSVGDGPQVLTDLRASAAAGDDLFGDATVGLTFIGFAISLVWLVTGSLIVSRQPKNTSGWIFVAVGTVLGLFGLPSALVITGVKVDPGSVPFVGAWAVFGDNAAFVVGLLPLLFLLFPDGHPPTPRWRIAEVALFAGLAVGVVGYVVTPGPLNNYVNAGILYENPLGVASLDQIAPVVAGIAGFVAIFASFSTIFAVRGRFKRSTGEARQQLRWLVLVATIVGVLFVLEILGNVVRTDFPLFPVGLALMALTVAIGVPASYLIAIYRYRLYDFDVVVKKAVVFAVMVGAVIALYLLIALLVPLVLVGAGGSLQTGAVLIGIVIGLLVSPVRTRAKRFADRVVYGRRATPYEVLTSFSGRVGETYATDDVLPRMAQILAEGVGADSARVWLHVGGTLRPEAAWPADATGVGAIAMHGAELPPIAGEDTVAVRHQGEVLGALSVRMPASDPMTPAKERLVQDLAEQAGLVLRNVGLIEDLRASRQRLVAAQDLERRKLERNIHDGAQQQLVALAVKLRLTEGLVEKDPAKAKEMLSQLQSETTNALEDLRDLARGIYPPLLADQGLAAALMAQARKAALPVTVEADGVGRLSQEIEAAIYFSCLEALQNVAKYARASRATVSLSEGEGVVRFSVTDDGAGFDPEVTGYGTGLQGIADRLASLDGAVDVVSAPGEGTSLRGRIPVTGGSVPSVV